MKNPIRFLAAFVLLACFAFAIPGGEPKQITVVIDAGHGGKDHGATIDAITEKQITDQVASKIKQLNKDSNIIIHFTRTDDSFMSFEERMRIINAVKPDLMLSLHVNHTTNGEANGMEFFVCETSKEFEKSSAYAEKLSDKFEGKYKIRGIKKAPFYMLKNSGVPAITFEMGFLSNAGDKAYLTSPEKQEELAKIILEFIKEIK